MYRFHQTTLQNTAAELRRRLGPGGSIVPLPSLRARDFVTVVRGVELPLGLASSQFHTAWLGDYAQTNNVRVVAVDGALAHPHIGALLPLFEEAARDRAALLIACDELDPSVFGMLVVNHQRNTMTPLPVTPLPGAGRAPLDAIASLAAARLGRSDARGLELGTRGVVPEVIATIDQVVVLGEFPGRSVDLGVIHVGGRDLAHARARVAELIEN